MGCLPLVSDDDGGGAICEAEVRGNKPVPSRALGRSRNGLTGTPVYWAAWVVPLLIIVGGAIWRRRVVVQGGRSGDVPAAERAEERTVCS